MFKKGRRWREVGRRFLWYLLPCNALSFKVVTPRREVAGGPLSYVRKNIIKKRSSKYIYKAYRENLPLPPAGHLFSSLNDLFINVCAGRRFGVFGHKTSCLPSATPCQIFQPFRSQWGWIS